MTVTTWLLCQFCHLIVDIEDIWLKNFFAIRILSHFQSVWKITIHEFSINVLLYFCPPIMKCLDSIIVKLKVTTETYFYDYNLCLRGKLHLYFNLRSWSEKRIQILKLFVVALLLFKLILTHWDKLISIVLNLTISVVFFVVYWYENRKTNWASSSKFLYKRGRWQISKRKGIKKATILATIGLFFRNAISKWVKSEWMYFKQQIRYYFKLYSPIVHINI